MRLIAPNAFARALASVTVPTSCSNLGNSSPAGEPSCIPACGTSRRPLSSSHTLYTASNPPSSALGSAEAVSIEIAFANAGYTSGHPVGPAALVIMDMQVPTVCRRNFDGWLSALNKLR